MACIEGAKSRFLREVDVVVVELAREAILKLPSEELVEEEEEEDEVLDFFKPSPSPKPRASPTTQAAAITLAMMTCLLFLALAATSVASVACFPVSSGQTFTKADIVLF
jgi:hypothetical protein